MSNTSEYNGPLSKEFLGRLTWMEVIVLYRDLQKFPEDADHARQVYAEIKRRSSRSQGEGSV